VLAAFALGAEGVQMGTRFAITQESSANVRFKELCAGLREGDTMLSLKKLSPTRLIKNGFFRQMEEAENRGASAEELKELIGFGRTRKGIFEGDLEDGELEIGQISSVIDDVPTVQEVFDSLLAEYRAQFARLAEM
uniref:NAD(P)H-dependent flavin oxidoreductase n=1 Tax=uncultured Bacteroides sp. TaxID=162156 RepID=UPI00261EDCDD